MIAGLAAAVAATLAGARGTQDAVANGDTRTLSIFHVHTKESASITFKRNGSYDQEALRQLSWLLRDWRLDEPTRMEPRLFEIMWEVYREVGADEPIHVVSAYRSSRTNAMLRRRSKAVSEYSQHMAGKAMDFHIPGVSMSRVREIGMRLQAGGVGFYPNSLHSFVHLDAGSVRSWPRMTSDQLARLFPDGRTVHLPRDGKPLPGYDVARSEILARGGTVAGIEYAEGGEAGGRKSLWAMLFGGGDDEDSDFYRSPASRNRASVAERTRVAALPASAAVSGNSDDGGMRGVAVMASVEPAASRARRPARSEVAALDRGAVPAGAAPGFEASPAPAIVQTAPAVPAIVPPFRPADATPAMPDAQAIVGVPTPPRRPDEPQVLPVLAPLPPSRPGTQFAGAATGLMRSEPTRPAGITAAAAHDERAALRALFDAAASQTAPSRRADIATSRARPEPVAGEPLPLDEGGAKLRMQFSAATAASLSPDRFTGPAVATLPTLR